MVLTRPTQCNRVSHILAVMYLVLLSIEPSCAIVLRKRSTTERFSETSIVCSGNEQCEKRYLPFYPKKGGVCCVTLSCSDTYRFYALTGGCTSSFDCERSINENADHYAIRMQYWEWAGRQRNILTIEGDSKCQLAKEEFLKGPPKPNDGTEFSPNGFDSPKQSAENVDCRNTKCSSNEVCCIRVSCDVHNDLAGVVAKPVCSVIGENECASGRGIKSYSAGIQENTVFWYPESEYKRYSLFESVRKNYGYTLSLAESCDTASGFFDWLYVSKTSSSPQRRR